MNYEKPDLYRPTKSNAIMFQLERFFFLVVKGNCPLENLYLILFASSLFYFLWHKGQRQCNIINGQQGHKIIIHRGWGCNIIIHFEVATLLCNIIHGQRGCNIVLHWWQRWNIIIHQWRCRQVHSLQNLCVLLVGILPCQVFFQYCFFILPLASKISFFSDLSLSSSPWSDSSGI